ncbi:glycosyltransferase [Selenomonas sp. AB3002]|uniref:glycosyltransferase n=1 Tax=Selenomonas sp. AB3002 TaxID=1392502 RepID=UPI000690125A
MIIYGVGDHLFDMLGWHKELASKIDRIFDKDKRKIGKKVDGLDILVEAPEKLSKLKEGTEVFVSAIRYYGEIKDEIQTINPGLRCRNIDELYGVVDTAKQQTSLTSFVDVLFINGCDISYPSRYRVSHATEQLYSVGMTSFVVNWRDVTNEMIHFCKCVVLYRCPWTWDIQELIDAAKKRHKPVFYDIDDLVIDTKYTDNIPYIKGLNRRVRRNYDDGVRRNGRVLRLCDGAITTTEALAEELKNYVPVVFINRNVASGTMVELSRQAARRGKDQIGSDKVTIGYFSGSSTHIDDLEMLIAPLEHLFEKYDSLEFLLVGEIDLPEKLKKYKQRIKQLDFVDWTKLPELIAMADINLAPLQDTLFNAAKSENKWMEASLVGVPTVASNVGAFAKMIIQGETGLLCGDAGEWEDAISRLVEDVEFRERIGDQAREYVMKNCLACNTGLKLKNFLASHMPRSVAFVLPSFTTWSGGIMVALQHAQTLWKHGADVTLINDDWREDPLDLLQEMFPYFGRLEYKKTEFLSKFDTAVATFWATVKRLGALTDKDRRYLVQNYEPGFYHYDNVERLEAYSTYCREDLAYITISRWCKDWLENRFGKHAAFVSNGLDVEAFRPAERSWNGKIRVLIEGDASEHKNIEEAFYIASVLPRKEFEVWYVSYNVQSMPWHRVDRVLNQVSYDEMPEVYKACHILLKTSKLESFSYPPLEMMATGGLVVLRANEGNQEYISDGENCLVYDPMDLRTAIRCIYRAVEDKALRDRLIAGGIETARKRDWKNIEKDIVKAYEANV